MSRQVTCARFGASSQSRRRASAVATIVSMLGFAGLVYADSGQNRGTKARRVGVASRVGKPVAVNDDVPANPSEDRAPLPLSSTGLSGPPNDRCEGAIPLPLNRVVIATTVGANDDYQSPPTAGCFSGIGQQPTTSPGKDIVFTFGPVPAGSYSIRIIQQGPNSDPTRTQNATLYTADASGGCPAPGPVACLFGANRPQSNSLTSATGGNSNQSEEIPCFHMDDGQVVYVFFDNAIGGAANPGGVTSLEAANCDGQEIEPNDTPATANTATCNLEGTASVGAIAHCHGGTRAGQVCTRSTPLDESFSSASYEPGYASHKVCSITQVDCSVNPGSGVSSCTGGPGDLCQQQTDLDCDSRCSAGPNAGLSCTTNGFCNPGSDLGAICDGVCVPDSTCVTGDPVPNTDTGVPCTSVCVGGLRDGQFCAGSAVTGAAATGLAGCPGGGLCTTSSVNPTVTTIACPSGQTCSRMFNEGDVDFYSLGTPPASSKVFATVDAKAASDYDFRMRITTDTKTLQFDDDDGIGRIGANAPVISGALTDGTPTYIKVSRSSARPSEPYSIRYSVRPPVAQAQQESEAGLTGNDIYYGWPGDVINANAINNTANPAENGYVKGSFGTATDSDCFKFLVDTGDLMSWWGDGNPSRAPVGSGSVEIPWPIMFDANSAAISNFIFGMSPGRRNNLSNVQATGLNNTTPATGPAAFLEWRATYTGMLEVCYYAASAALGPNGGGGPVSPHPVNWVGSLTVNCGPLRAAGPGTTTTDVALTKTGPAGPVNTGSFVTYTIQVTNSGSDIAQEVHLFDALDPSLSFIKLTIDDGFDNPNTTDIEGNNTACFSLPTPGANDAPIDCINTSMAPGTTTTYTLTVQVNNCIGAGLTISNTATIDTVSTDTDPSNDQATTTFVTSEDGSCADLSCDTSTSSCIPDLCTNNGHCDAGVCVSDPLNCDDGSVCTVDSCDAAVGCINDSSQTGDLCDDFNPCTTNACDPVLFCVFPPAPAGTSCDDGLSCTTPDACDGQGNCAGVSVCDDGNPCTDDFADPANACACSHAPSVPGTLCNDGNPCTGTLALPDACDGANTCVGGQNVTCDDADACTADSCDPATGCVNTPITCDDGDVCNGTETCNSVTGCVGGTPLLCNDGNACTTDTCIPLTGCSFTNNTSLCDDGDACTIADTCSGGVCVGGTPLLCNDGNACTTDTCIPPTGCSFTNNTNSCDDGNACTTADACSGGACIGGTPLVCNDGNACNGVETCDSGTGCVAGTPVVCTPSDSCHNAGTCDAGTGVCSDPVKPNGATCDDADACTTADTCSNGACAGGPPLDCDDGDACTADDCDPASGCVAGEANMDTTAASFSEFRVDGRDLVVLASAWNSCPGDPLYNADANLDRVTTVPGVCVDSDDFHLFMNAFGHSCL